VYDTVRDVLSVYGLQLALYFGWPGLLAGGLLGAALFPRWRISAALAGAVAGVLMWMACWLTVALSLRMMVVTA
jgi:hypothetical protein